MMEIERKFLIKKMPDLSGVHPIRYERYFLKDDGARQVRVQKKGNNFEIETKTRLNDLEYEKTKRIITESEFLELSAGCEKSIIRDGWLVSKNPEITIKKYYGDYDGLIRAEVEFEDADHAMAFVPPDWFGIEITGTDLGNDNKLIKLNRAEFLKKLEKLTG